jgi:microcystin synthetase protein McyJ
MSPGEAGWHPSAVDRRAASYYTSLGDDVLEGLDDGFRDPSKPLWLNLGDWREARTYPAACAALAIRLAEAAGLKDGDEVLDAGFGFGEQDLLWSRRYALGRIVGINVTPLHVQAAQSRAAQSALAGRLQFTLGSATRIPEPPASFDKVLSLEAAFHFDTRELFFREAFRVLRPGGTIGLTDMIPLPGWSAPEKAWPWEERHGVPLANMYDRDVYGAKLREAGFVDVSVQSIRNDVYPGMARFVRERLTGRRASDIVVSLTDREIAECRGVELWEPYGIGDYVLCTATRP